MNDVPSPPYDSATPPPPPPGDGKAELGKRLVAALIDAVISGVISIAIPAVGGIIGACYMVLRDGLEFDFMNHRSIGKHVMKLRVERLDGGVVDVNTSLRRNWMFGVGALVPVLLFIPILGWLMIPFVGLAALVLGVIEIVLVLTDAQGRRFGDKLANTRVVEE